MVNSMARQVTVTDKKTEFAQLMQHGRSAFDRGAKQLAHNLWREAALLDPYNEQVWLALLDVLETRDDQRVCLENILSINPMNTQARRMLRAYTVDDQKKIEKRAKDRRKEAGLRRQRRVIMSRALILGLLLGVTGIIFAIIIGILVYA